MAENKYSLESLDHFNMITAVLQICQVNIDDVNLPVLLQMLGKILLCAIKKNNKNNNK